MAPIDFEEIKPVTTAVLRQVIDAPFFVEFRTAIKQGDVVSTKQGADGQAMKPADVAQVVNLETGEVQTLICNAVLKSELEKNYPKAGYVGKQFRIVQHAKTGGKRYNPYSISEIKLKRSK